METLSRITAAVASWSDDLAVREPLGLGQRTPALVVWPESAESVADVLRLATENGLVVVPVGGGTTFRSGNPPHRYDIALSLSSLTGIVEYEPADLTITAQAGITVEQLAGTVAPERQRLALDPPFADRGTLGGTLASASTGPGRLRFGGARDNVLGLRFALSDGTIANAGGRVVKNVAGYDLTRLLVGSYGTLAVIVEACLKLYGRPETTHEVGCRFATFDLAAGWMRKAVQVGAEAAFLARLGDEWRAFARFAGSSTSVKRQVEMLLTSVEARDDLGSIDLAAEYRTWEHLPYVIRMSVPPSGLATVAAIGSEIADSVLVCESTGVARVGVTTISAAEVARLRQRIGSLGGSVVLERQPDDGEWIDAWGPAPATFPLMRGLKASIDPTGTLSPGRFVGGL